MILQKMTLFLTNAMVTLSTKVRIFINVSVKTYKYLMHLSVKIWS